jgi:hypothetical protein
MSISDSEFSPIHSVVVQLGAVRSEFETAMAVHEEEQHTLESRLAAVKKKREKLKRTFEEISSFRESWIVDLEDLRTNSANARARFEELIIAAPEVPSIVAEFRKQL